jgi:hypothetical protein
MFSVAVVVLAVIVGALIIPGGRISAANPDPVQVTNVPLPVTVGNFPETVRVGGTVGAVQSGPWTMQQSGPWTVQVASPKRFHQMKNVNLFGGGSSQESEISAPEGAVIETISVFLNMPPGQKPTFAMLLYNDPDPFYGFVDGAIFVPVQFRYSFDGTDYYGGTLTSLGVRASQKMRVQLARDNTIGTGSGVVTVAGYIP